MEKLLEKIGAEETEQLRQRVQNFLLDLMRIRSYSNEEKEACEFAFQEFSKIPGVQVRKLPMDNSIKDDPLWCCGPIGNNDYTDHFNIEIVWKGTGEQDPIYFNAHIDTVFASNGDENLLHPKVEGDIIYGLGACDDKGGIAAIYTAFCLLSRFGKPLPFDVIAHIVVEEEIGGNGALAVTKTPMRGQAAIVMEPTNQNVQPVHRAGLWLRMVCEGVSVHTAAMHKNGLSGYELALKAVDKLKAMHKAYQEECKENPVKYYEDYQPMLNIGMFHTGDWPATVPRRAVVCCSIGVLPNLTTAQMKARISKLFEEDEELRGKIHCSYIFDRDSSVLDFSHPLVQEVVKCVKENGMAGGIEAMKCLSDKYFYQEVLHIPTVNFGPGEIQHAHSGEEQVHMSHVLTCGNILHDFLLLRAAQAES